MEIELHLEQLAVDLDIAARDARARMQKSERRTLSTFDGQTEHRKWLNALLREMASVVDRTIVSSNGTSENRRLYVWPGYDSVLLDGGRVTFEVDQDIQRTLGLFGYDSGLMPDGKER